MSPISALLATTLKQHFGWSVWRDKYIRRKQDLWQPPLFLLIAIGIAAPLFMLYMRILNSTYAMSVQMNQPGLILLLGFTAAQAMVLFFGIFYLISVFYFSKDLELLVPLPLSPTAIMSSKLVTVLLSEYLTVLPLALPPFILYGVRQGMGFSYWLLGVFLTLLLPLLPLALASICTVLLMHFTRLARRPDTVRVISSLLLVAGIVILQTKVVSIENDPDELMRLLVQGPNSLLSLIGKRFPPALWGAQALIEDGWMAARQFILYLSSTLFSGVALWAISRRFFYQSLLINATTAPTRHKHARQRLSPQRPAWVALVQREWQLLIRDPIFALTAAQALIIPPLLLGIALFSGSSVVQIRTLITMPAVQIWIGLGLAALIAINPVMSSVPASSVSREGRLFWISRTIPTPATTQLLAKLILCELLTITGGVLIIAILIWLGVPSAVAATGLALGLLYAISLNALAMCVDVIWPQLEWTNPQQAMKGNNNNLVAFLLTGGLTYLLARVAIWGYKAGWSPDSITVAMSVIFLVLAVISVILLFHLGRALYNPVTQLSTNSKSRSSIGSLFRQKGRTIIIIAAIAAFVLFTGRELLMGVKLEYTFGPDSIKFGNTTISYVEITELQYLEQIPRLSNRVGTSAGNYASGTFTVEGIGRGYVFAKDVTQPALLIRTEETFYIITPENAAQHYREVQEKLE